MVKVKSGEMRTLSERVGGRGRGVAKGEVFRRLEEWSAA
jgi:hypothetical protein